MRLPEPLRRIRVLPIVGAAAIASLFVGGCVVTTYEGPHEPPNTPAPPQAASLAPAKAGPAVISASHLLVQYRGARAAGLEVTRSKDEALARALEAFDAAKAGVDFEKIVAEYSDEPGAAARGGQLGKFSRDQMVPEFSDAAFELEVGQVSRVVETPYGFHVIRRAE